MTTTGLRSGDINIPAVGAMSESPTSIFQPLHESIRNKLDPEYVKLHDEILQYCAPSESEPWSADIRSRPSLIAFASPKLVEVGNVADFNVDEYQVRVFIPGTEPPVGGWPCFVYVSLPLLPINALVHCNAR
jgi:hypothetical protein